MFLAIDGILDAAMLAAVQTEAADLAFEDGAKTAGRFAHAVKANDQAVPCPARDGLLAVVSRALQAHPVFAAAARVRAMTPLILSRYRTGQTYGLHVDDAVMGGLRTDISFTLFLAEPDSYTGGALILEDSLEARAVKLAAGSVFLYPSTTLHRVDPVTAGTRLTVVGWVQSQVRRADQREILFDLDQGIAALHASGGKSALFDSLCKTRSNLLRMWVE
ncbi:PKHD-type hydroxylase [Pseudorhodobacter antarcticus]|uniref:PKHD-type hydroxylase n=1 Tax=Pseudorhodobacter antarcticus TaxID=1077947 RepID=A0A1H8IYD1_9RHOB|nr:Fe2+-dependent dioxygenase [Pseudorhodobacter antarcticus]SEN72937.1 PKHD-type hydroxylase [Pseudorhodobacter antarcticus]